MVQNWYNKIKQAQVMPLSSHEECPLAEDRDGVKKGPGQAVFPYQVGMKVRDRRKGIALPQEYGIIKDIDNKKITIVWHNKKKKQEQSYDINDTITLSAIVAEV